MLLQHFLDALIALPQCSYSTSFIYKKNRKLAYILSTFGLFVIKCNNI